jgi:protein-tyrosine-phosphatase
MTTPTVLFLCPHNALRSVIAAALLNHLADGRARGISAGTEPDERVNERTITVLREVRIEVGNEKPGKVSREQLQQADRVISLGCPLPPELASAAVGKIEEWPMPDTAGKPVEAVREVRELIKTRVQQLMGELDATSNQARA